MDPREREESQDDLHHPRPWGSLLRPEHDPRRVPRRQSRHCRGRDSRCADAAQSGADVVLERDLPGPGSRAPDRARGPRRRRDRPGGARAAHHHRRAVRHRAVNDRLHPEPGRRHLWGRRLQRHPPVAGTDRPRQAHGVDRERRADRGPRAEDRRGRPQAPGRPRRRPGDHSGQHQELHPRLQRVAGREPFGAGAGGQDDGPARRSRQSLHAVDCGSGRL
jgi:hypothetical protein